MSVGISDGWLTVRVQGPRDLLPLAHVEVDRLVGVPAGASSLQPQQGMTAAVMTASVRWTGSSGTCRSARSGDHICDDIIGEGGDCTSDDCSSDDCGSEVDRLVVERKL
jgi:hypothetical protein